MPADETTATPRRDPATIALYKRLANLKVRRRFFRTLDPAHAAVFAEGSDTLVVTFERTESITAQGEAPMPLGHELHETFGWSFLTVLATGQTWYRSEPLYALIDDLVDRGLFDHFERVVFYGAGTSAHAACAFSVAAPGATVIALSPQATITPERAAFDDRFRECRRLDFTSRYGYAPRMLDAAASAHIFHDPTIPEDAAHAAQFNADHICLHRLRHFGENPETVLRAMDGITKLFALYEDDRLTEIEIARLMRERRTNRSYLMRVQECLLRANRPYLEAVVCNYIVNSIGGPRFRRRRDMLTERLNAQGIRLPFQTAEDVAAAQEAGAATAQGA